MSGYDGCESILEESTENNIIHSGQKIHYSKKEFQNIKFLNGNEQKNNNIDGYASIIYLSNNYKLALILDN